MHVQRRMCAFTTDFSLQATKAIPKVGRKGWIKIL